jgi:dihydroorotate dehydrogenase subfamily 2
LAQTLVVNDKKLQQTVAGIHFANPIGLSAGFDYEAKLTQLLPAIGFGFETIGTITNSAYEGNPKPMLGRLPKSQSLLVNKGFKNPGADAIVKKLKDKSFAIPIGVSIGRTNTPTLNQKQSIQDIINAFTTFEKSPLKHAYYELNISCPNLYGDISFYPPKNLKALLVAIDALRLQKPVFVKMPISLPDTEITAILEVIAKHSPQGIILGNLQKDRDNPALRAEEVAACAKGYFSGKPTYDRSNELIELAYKRYQKRFIIIGTGGIFSAEDAYEKITRGATLVQLITGMIFQGPQLINEINTGLLELMRRDGFSHMKDAIGSKFS